MAMLDYRILKDSETPKRKFQVDPTYVSYGQFWSRRRRKSAGKVRFEVRLSQFLSVGNC